ncbi:MAG: hypothetical protein EAZ44_07785 [Cytophagia bacterium]|nr:MAG: hypothetical protein EAZ44_07785 [Cytophagia bacterium]TAG39548.1 MAG: hypothetical protein EAZ31_09060 [Cytophagia bacterium]
MNFINSAVRWVLTRRLSKIKHFMKNPFEVQYRTLQNLVKKAENTEFGKKYQFTQQKTYTDFQNKVPVSTYEDLSPFIERMMKGEKNVLWSSKIDWFSKSSGTTNARSKFIPVSYETLFRCHQQGGRDMLALYLENEPNSKFFWGKGLSIGGTFQKNPDFPAIRFGDISAVIVQNLPSWAQSLRTPPIHIAMMDKWEEKIEAMANYTMNQKITSLLGVPTWMVVVLQRILELKGKKHIEEVWGNLEVFMHGAVAFTPYRELFKSLAPTLKYMEIYNASEGFFGLQDDMTRDDMLLMLDYEVFYEFIPMSDIELENPSVIPLEQVELDKNYAILISTSAGLWRYKIGDTVKFTSKFPYRIKITGRTKHFINAFGEEVIIENAETALAYACKETDALVSNFTAAPVYMGEGGKQGGHEWLIEFEKQPLNLDKFTDCLDSKLREINSDYDAKRYQDIALLKPIVHNLPQNTFYNWLKSRGKLGGQNKVPRLSNSREYIEDILKSMGAFS